MKLQTAMLSSNNFSEKYRIYYEDTDAGGVVYYANYLKFFERARTDFLRAKEILQSEMLKNENLIFVVKSCNVEYIRPARLDDIVEVSVKIKEFSTASIIMQQEMKRGEELVSKLEVVIVSIDATSFKPKRIPDFVKNQF